MKNVSAKTGSGVNPAIKNVLVNLEHLVTDMEFATQQQEIVFVI